MQFNALRCESPQIQFVFFIVGSVIWTYKSVVALFLIVEVRNKGLGYILEGFLFLIYLFPFSGCHLLSKKAKILVHSEKGEMTGICSSS